MSSLYVERRGTGPRVVLLHGFTQSSACWPVLADALAQRHEVLAVDLPRHGTSADVPGNLDATADLLSDLARDAVVVGYSMGARYALTLAVQHPASVRGLVLVSGTAGIDDEAARAARRDADEARAARLETIGLDAFLEEWLRQPLFSDVPPERSCREARARNTVAGLAASLREAGTGVMVPLWDRVAALDVPVLLLTGELDHAYTAHAQRMTELLAGATQHVVIDGVGHAAHLVDPDAVLAALILWLEELESRYV